MSVARSSPRGKRTDDGSPTGLKMYHDTFSDSGRVEMVPIGEIRPSPENDTVYRPVDVNDPAFRKSAESIRKKIHNPLIVTLDGFIVGARAQVWFLKSATELAAQIQPTGRHNACFLTRSSHFTGEIQTHELAWSGENLWVVNTAFSCLCTLDDQHSFVPRWRPPFVSGLAAEDRCHLNGLAMASSERGTLVPQYVTALAETDTLHGWRPNKTGSGCLIDVASGETAARGLAMPHSPRVHAGRVWMLHSGAGQLVLVDPAKGQVQTVTEFPGYTRGLAMFDRYAFVGLSKIRETSTFGGMPIAERRPELKCGVGVVDLTTGRLVAHIEFVTGVEEIFDVQVLKGARCPAISGPYPNLDGSQPIWTVPT